MNEVLGIVAVIAGGIGAFIWSLRSQYGVDNSFDIGLECSVCGRETVTEGDPGHYHCMFCGYDTEADYAAEMQAEIRALQDLRMAVRFLEDAGAKFGSSHHRFVKVQRGPDKGKTRETGPDFGAFLDGVEKTHDIIRMCNDLREIHPSLEEVARKLQAIPVPPSDKYSFNPVADQAVAATTAAHPILARTRAAAEASLIAKIRERTE